MSNRRFWQIHLSTAVVLMVVASVLVYGNLTYSHQTLIADGLSVNEHSSSIGLPLPCVTKTRRLESSPAGIIKTTRFTEIKVLPLAANIAATILFLGGLATAVEILQRRREARKP